MRHSLSSYVARNHEATYEDAIEKWIDSLLLADYAAPGLEWGGTVCSKREGLLIKESWGEGLQDSDRSLYQSVIIIKATETK